MPLTPQDIVRKEFREAFRGYNQTDVDLFLDEVVEELTRLADENQKMRVRLAALQQELGRFRETRSSRAQQQMASRYAELASEDREPEPAAPTPPPPPSTPAVPPLRSDPPPRRPAEDRPAARQERVDPFAPRVERPVPPPPPASPRPGEPSRPTDGGRVGEPMQRPSEAAPREPQRASDPFPARTEQPQAPRPGEPRQGEPRPAEPSTRDEFDAPSRQAPDPSEPRTEPTEPVTERWKPPQDGGSFWDR